MISAARKRRQRRQPRAPIEIAVPPPPERGQHDDQIIRSDRQVPDSRGSVGNPFIVVGLLR
jgi:hypothetical protein